MTLALVFSVIPAKAGIHNRFRVDRIVGLVNIDSRLRGNDEVFGMTDAR